MISTSTIVKELAPFFKYDNKQNPSRIIYQEPGPNGHMKVQRIYQNCISCNTQRFTFGHPAYHFIHKQSTLLGAQFSVKTHFCDACMTKITKISLKEEYYNNPKNSLALKRVFENALFSKRYDKSK